MDKETIDGMINVGYIDTSHSNHEFHDIIDALQAVEVMKSRLEHAEQMMHDQPCDCTQCKEFIIEKKFIISTLGPIIGSVS